jgi:hypothetical protein
MVDGDSFIMNSLANWEFGRDNTGNIMNKHNIRVFRDRVLSVAPVDVFTGDGGIGCDENPEEQERMTGRLVLYEVLAGLGVLKPHGCMIIKMFTTFTSCSLACIAFIASQFRRCYMLKPATSKSSNSEIYVVACDFLGLPSVAWYDSLLDSVAAADLDARSLMRHDLISPEWRALYESASSAFADLTIFNLQRILSFVEPRAPDAPPPVKETDLTRIKSQWSSIFGRRHCIAHLPATSWIAQKQILPPAGQSATSLGQKRMRSGGNMEERRDTNKLRETIVSGDSSALEKIGPSIGGDVVEIAIDPKFARMLGGKAGTALATTDAAVLGQQGSGGSIVIEGGESVSLKSSEDAAGREPTSLTHISGQASSSSSVLSAILGAQRSFGDRSGLGAFSCTSAPVRLHCSASDLRVAAVFGAPFTRVVHSKFCSKKHPAVASSLTLVFTLAQARLQRQGRVQGTPSSCSDRSLLHCGKIAQVLLSASVLPHLLSIPAETLSVLNG